MQEKTTSFTGRKRYLKNRRSVKLADRIAQSLITVGGIGTILAISTVGLFLFWVVLPLFLPAKSAALGKHPSGKLQSEGVLHLGVDEYRSMLWSAL